MISQKESQYLRDLAKRQWELSQLENNKALEKKWKRHNAVQGESPLVVVEYETFYQDIRPTLFCESSLAREIEEELKKQLNAATLIGDDRVIPDFYSTFLPVTIQEFGITLEKKQVDGADGIAYEYEHPITDLEKDFEKLHPSTFFCDYEAAQQHADQIEEIIGNILPVKLRNTSLLWHGGLTQKAVNLMGMEQLYISMYDCPEALHRFMSFLADDFLHCVSWQQNKGLLTPNWGNEHAGSNSFGFTDELPKHHFQCDDLRKGKTDIAFSDLWLNTNSQESVGISPDCFQEFILPYYQRICREAGLVYYGCCEPVHDIFTDGLDQISNLRKLSISAWCDEKKIAEQLRGKRIVYSRKPSPNYLGVEKELNEKALQTHIMATLKAAQGLDVEFIFRDIYTLNGNVEKIKRAVEIVRQCIAECW